VAFPDPARGRGPARGSLHALDPHSGSELRSSPRWQFGDIGLATGQGDGVDADVR